MGKEYLIYSGDVFRIVSKGIYRRVGFITNAGEISWLSSGGKFEIEKPILKRSIKTRGGKAIYMSEEEMFIKEL